MTTSGAYYNQNERDELRDESLEDSANLPDPDILAAEIIKDPQSALEELQAISDDLALTPGAHEGDEDG